MQDSSNFQYIDRLAMASFGYVDAPECICPVHIKPVDGSGHHVAGSFVHSCASTLCPPTTAMQASVTAVRIERAFIVSP
jgi:hypothetical protein